MCATEQGPLPIRAGTAEDFSPARTSGRCTPRRALQALSASLALALALPALAQQAPSREQEQIRRLRQQTQQLQQELAAAQQSAQAARAEAEQRAASAQAEASRARRSASGAAERVKELEAELDTLRSAQASQQARQAELTLALEGAQGELRTTRNELGARSLRLTRREGELEALEARFRGQNAALDLCTRHNQTLRSVSLDLLGRWQRMDWRDALAAKEPFVQTERVRIENLVQGYEEQIDRATLARPAAAGASGPAPRP